MNALIAMGEYFAFDPAVLAAIGAALLAGIALAAWSGGKQRWTLIALQPLAAGLLLAALSVRDAPATATLAVLAPGVEAQAVDAVEHLPRVALPGAPQGEGIEPVPDLATALRRHPTQHLVVIGDGLRAHDRAAVGERGLEFRPSSAPARAAIVELDAPASVRAGRWWTVRGRVQAASGASVVLLDPAGTTVAEATPGDDGRFALESIARAPGTTMFEVQLREGDKVLQTLPVPLLAQVAAPLRALVLAGSPSPELKYLRRWALDAGVQLETRVALAPGLVQRRGPASLDAVQLAQLDLLIVDERSWPQLASLQPVLREAVDAGLGLLVRATGPVPERVSREWAAWGLDAPTAAKPVSVRLPASPRTELHAWLSAADATRPVLFAAVDGTPLVQWSAQGRGRVGLWHLTDTHRLYTRGERERHATLWSDAFTTLARARGAAAPSMPARALIGERAVFCELAPEASITPPGGERIPLSIENGCAAFWPRESGWHRLVSGDAEHRFAVHDPIAIEPLLAHERRTATQALARGQAQEPSTRTMDRNLLRTLLLAAWLAAMAMAWGLERRARKARGMPAAE